ncbi:unnamed protein product [Sphenostylis stenocarpa]|uniref:RSE1/DDB1/CPSF1 first beta-propeller domain-containing protein n=1 Tax=Sphenostylis stenocarpa TaxID=92480 RepID=A0AA86W365_9FABA|nr:unnamed protein product [Sphenostylis stenocarpa]
MIGGVTNTRGVGEGTAKVPYLANESRPSRPLRRQGFLPLGDPPIISLLLAREEEVVDDELQIQLRVAVSEEECSSAKSGPSSSSSASRYYLSKCVLRGSVVLQVLHAHIRSPSSNDIVFGKETSIELVVIEEDGNVQSVCDQPVFGTIKDLAILSWNEKFRARDPQLWGLFL